MYCVFDVCPHQAHHIYQQRNREYQLMARVLYSEQPTTIEWPTQKKYVHITFFKLSECLYLIIIYKHFHPLMLHHFYIHSDLKFQSLFKSTHENRIKLISNLSILYRSLSTFQALKKKADTMFIPLLQPIKMVILFLFSG